MNLPPIPPGLVLLAAGLLLIPLRQRGLRAAVMLAAPLLALGLAALLPDGEPLRTGWLGIALSPLRLDGLSRLFALVFCLAAFGAGLFALRQPGRLELSAAYVHAGAAVGAALAGDLVTLLLWWEAMALAGTLVVWAGGGAALRPGMRYLAIHLLGGALMMAGIAGHVAATGDAGFGAVGTGSPAGWLILAGILVNAAAPPVSAWVADAYPRASWSGMVFLSAFTTKLAVYALIRGFPGEPALVWLGLAMALYGIVYAVREDDMRRLLAYSLVGQVGLMVAAAGIGGEAALAGAAAQAVAHILYGALLVMAAGAVLASTGTARLSRLGGLARTMPLTAACLLLGAAAISGLPLTSGFVAKGMIIDAAPSPLVSWLLTAASAGTAFYAGFRLPWLALFATGRGGSAGADPPAPMRAAMLLMAAATLAVGLWPPLLLGLLPFAADHAPYTAQHVGKQVLLIAAAGLAFALLRRLVPAGARRLPDLDWLWRRPPALLARSAGRLGAAAGRRREAWREAWRRLAARRDGGWPAARAGTAGSLAFWSVVLLAGWLILYYS